MDYSDIFASGERVQIISSRGTVDGTILSITPARIVLQQDTALKAVFNMTEIIGIVQLPTSQSSKQENAIPTVTPAIPSPVVPPPVTTVVDVVREPSESNKEKKEKKIIVGTKSLHELYDQMLKTVMVRYPAPVKIDVQQLKEYENTFKERYGDYVSRYQSAVQSFLYAYERSKTDLDKQNINNKTLPAINVLKELYRITKEEELARIIAYIYTCQTDSKTKRNMCLKEAIEFLRSTQCDTDAAEFLLANGELPYSLETWRLFQNTPEIILAAIALSPFERTRNHCELARRLVEDVSGAFAVVSATTINVILYALQVKLNPTHPVTKQFGESATYETGVLTDLCGVVRSQLCEYVESGTVLINDEKRGWQLYSEVGDIVWYPDTSSFIAKNGDKISYTRQIDGTYRVKPIKVIREETDGKSNLTNLHRRLSGSKTSSNTRTALEYISKVLMNQQDPPLEKSPKHEGSAQERKPAQSYADVTSLLHQAKTKEECYKLVPFIEKYSEHENPFRNRAIKNLVELYCRRVVGNYEEAVRIVEKYRSRFENTSVERIAFTRIGVEAYIGAKLFDNAIEQLKYINENSPNPHNQVRLAYCYIMTEQYDIALRSCDAVLNAWPKPAAAELSPTYTYKFTALLELGRIDEAQSVLDIFASVSTNTLKSENMRIILEQSRLGENRTDQNGDMVERLLFDEYESVLQFDEQSFYLEEAFSPHLNMLVETCEYTGILDRQQEKTTKRFFWEAKDAAHAQRMLDFLYDRSAPFKDGRIRNGVLDDVSKTRLTMAAVSLNSCRSFYEAAPEFRTKFIENAALMYWTMATHGRVNGKLPLASILFYYHECTRLFSMLKIQDDDLHYEYLDATNMYIGLRVHSTSEKTTQESILSLMEKDSNRRGKRRAARLSILKTIKDAIQTDAERTTRILAVLLHQCRSLENILLNPDLLQDIGLNLTDSLLHIIGDAAPKEATLTSLLTMQYQRIENYMRELIEFVNEISEALRISQNAEQLRILVNRLQTHIQEDKELCLYDSDHQICIKAIEMLQSYCSTMLNSNYQVKQAECSRIISDSRLCVDDIQKAPTAFTYNYLVRLIEHLRDATENFSVSIAKDSAPRISVTDEKEEEGYRPINHRITVQLRIKNEHQCTPAQNVRVTLKIDESIREYVEVADLSPTYHIGRPIDGGDDFIQPIELLLTKNGAQPDAVFPLEAFVNYKTIQNQDQSTQPRKLNIRIQRDEEWANIQNPYTRSALEPSPQSNRVFYGRDKDIQNICNAFFSKDQPGQTVFLFGQYRSGKTSLLNYTLDQIRKSSEPTFWIVNVGSFNTDQPFEDVTKRFVNGICNAISVHLGEVSYDINLHDHLMKYKNRDINLSPYDRFFIEFVVDLKAFLGTLSPKPRILLTGDEFGRYFSKNDPLRFFEMWKEVMELHTIDAIFVAHDVVTQIIRTYQNPFGTANLHQIDYIDHEPLVDLIERPTEYTAHEMRQTRFKAEVVQEIERLSSGNVFYVSDICRKLIDYMNAHEINQVNKLDLEICLQEWIGKSLEGEFEIIGHPLFDAGEIGPEAITNNENILVLNSIIEYHREHSSEADFDLQSIILSNHSRHIPNRERAERIIESLLTRRVIKIDDDGQFQIRVRFYEEYLYDAFFKTFKGWRV